MSAPGGLLEKDDKALLGDVCGLLAELGVKVTQPDYLFPLSAWGLFVTVVDKGFCCPVVKYKILCTGCFKDLV